MMRYIHLTLAIIASLFFALAAVTGAIIGLNNIDRQYPSYRAEHLDQITLAQSIAGVKEAYQEVNSLTIDPRGFAVIKATDKEGKEVNAHIGFCQIHDFPTSLFGAKECGAHHYGLYCTLLGL